jgi:hypothetical protein
MGDLTLIISCLYFFITPSTIDLVLYRGFTENGNDVIWCNVCTARHEKGDESEGERQEASEESDDVEDEDHMGEDDKREDDTEDEMEDAEEDGDTADVMVDEEATSTEN